MMLENISTNYSGKLDKTPIEYRRVETQVHTTGKVNSKSTEGRIANIILYVLYGISSIVFWKVSSHLGEKVCKIIDENSCDTFLVTNIVLPLSIFILAHTVTVILATCVFIKTQKSTNSFDAKQ